MLKKINPRLQLLHLQKLQLFLLIIFFFIFVLFSLIYERLCICIEILAYLSVKQKSLSFLLLSFRNAPHNIRSIAIFYIKFFSSELIPYIRIWYTLADSFTLGFIFILFLFFF